MDRPVRIGVIGTGSVAEKYIPHAQRLGGAHPIADVAAVCDLDPARLEVARTAYGIEYVTTDYREILDDPSIDLVLVLTSMQGHGDITLAALLAGKHVLVEKPMSMDLAQAAEIVEVARTCPGYLVCAPHVVLSPTYQAMWRLVHGGDIGKVYSARGFYGWAGPSWGQWFYQPGGGAMFDLGVYNVTTLTGLLGPAKRVMAMSGIAVPQRVVDNELIDVKTDDNAQLLLDFGDATYAVITTGFTIQRYKVPGIELYGSEGTIQMIGEDWAPTGYELWRNRDGFWQTHDLSSWRWTDGIRHIVESIRAGTPPVITPEHAYHVLEIMIRTMDSGRTGKAYEIESTFTPPRFDQDPAATEAAHLVHDPGAAV